jgi:hypothetical protein
MEVTQKKSAGDLINLRGSNVAAVEVRAYSDI